MQRKGSKTGLVIACLLCIIPYGLAQYTITGGDKKPLLAADNTSHRIQVYLVYGMDNVEISYTSSASTHQWYRYKQSALEGEKVNSIQDGNTSTIRQIEEGYGYFVEENNVTQRYIWVIDYSKYAFNISNLQVAENSNFCSNFRLTGTANTEPFSYYTPVGRQTLIERSFDITYQTLEWMESNKRFSKKEITKTVEGNPFETVYPAPLCDTYVRLTGDLFARHFGIEKSAQIDDFIATALEVYSDTILTSTETPSMGEEGDELSAPATILFRAFANEPVADHYAWTFYKKTADDEMTELFTRFQEETEETFTESGEYYVELEVSDRIQSGTPSRTCSDNTINYSFSIADYFISIPNAFSPGSTPGINDEFKIKYKSIVRFKGWIFNRWGVEMFHWTDPSVGWDGKKGGKYVPPGAYYYIIEFEGSDGKKHKRAGDINILRPKEVRDAIQ